MHIKISNITLNGATTAAAATAAVTSV